MWSTDQLRAQHKHCTHSYSADAWDVTSLQYIMKTAAATIMVVTTQKWYNYNSNFGTHLWVHTRISGPGSIPAIKLSSLTPLATSVAASLSTS